MLRYKKNENAEEYRDYITHRSCCQKHTKCHPTSKHNRLGYVTFVYCWNARVCVCVCAHNARPRARVEVYTCMHAYTYIYASLTSVQTEVPLLTIVLALDLLRELGPDQLPEAVVHQSFGPGGGTHPGTHPEPAQRAAQAVVLERTLQAAQAEVMCARQRHWLDQDAAAYRARQVAQMHVRSGTRHRVQQLRRALQVHLPISLRPTATTANRWLATCTLGPQGQQADR